MYFNPNYHVDKNLKKMGFSQYFTNKKTLFQQKHTKIKGKRHVPGYIS